MWSLSSSKSEKGKLPEQEIAFAAGLLVGAGYTVQKAGVVYQSPFHASSVNGLIQVYFWNQSNDELDLVSTTKPENKLTVAPNKTEGALFTVGDILNINVGTLKIEEAGTFIITPFSVSFVKQK